MSLDTIPGPHFDEAVFLQLLRASQPILIEATDIANYNPAVVKLKFNDHYSLKAGENFPGPEYKKVLVRCSDNYRRFDFVLGYTFIQVSISSFQVHNNHRSSNFRVAFANRDDKSKNQN